MTFLFELKTKTGMNQQSDLAFYPLSKVHFEEHKIKVPCKSFEKLSSYEVYTMEINFTLIFWRPSGFAGQLDYCNKLPMFKAILCGVKVQKIVMYVVGSQLL